MKTLEEYRAELTPLLPENAFLRIDRGVALFVTDAPMRSGKPPVLPDEYETSSDSRLLRITPKLNDLPKEAKNHYITYLKTKDDASLRRALSLCMRAHNTEAAARLERMLYET